VEGNGISRRQLLKGAGLVHCRAGAPSVASQRMFDWLDEHV
jgi:hypothetical protein